MSQRSAEITRVAIMVEVDGNPHAVTLPHEQMMVLMKIATGFGENGALPLVALPEGFEFSTVGEVREGAQ